MEDKGHGGLRRVPTAHSPLIACRLPKLSWFFHPPSLPKGKFGDPSRALGSCGQIWPGDKEMLLTSALLAGPLGVMEKSGVSLGLPRRGRGSFHQPCSSWEGTLQLQLVLSTCPVLCPQRRSRRAGLWPTWVSASLPAIWWL